MVADGNFVPVASIRTIQAARGPGRRLRAPDFTEPQGGASDFLNSHMPQGYQGKALANTLEAQAGTYF
jgi:hypothetical protein